MRGDDDFKKFLEVLDSVWEMYGKPPMGDAGAALFFQALEPYPVEVFGAAVAEHIRLSPFLPKPADLVKLIEGSGEDRARAAWQEVLRACQVHGVYRSVRFEDPRIHFAISAMGGWIKVGQISEGELPFREKDFVSHFRLAERLGVTWSFPRIPAHLPGHCEIENRFSGAEVEPPVLASAPAPRLEAREGPKRLSGPTGDYGRRVTSLVAGLARRRGVSDGQEG